MLNSPDQYIRFKREGKLIRDQANTIFQEGDIDLVGVKDRKVGFGRLVELEKDYSFFTLGHLYTSARVPYSFIEQYMSELGDAEILTFETPGEFLEGLRTPEGTWGNILHAIQQDRFEEFTTYMTRQYLSRKEEGLLLGIYKADCVIPDPIFKFQPGYRDMEGISVRVFLPQSQQARWVPLVSPATGNVMVRTLATPPEAARDLMMIKTINQGAHNNG